MLSFVGSHTRGMQTSGY